MAGADSGASIVPDLWGSGRHTNQKTAANATATTNPIAKFTYLTTRAAIDCVIGDVNNDNRMSHERWSPEKRHPEKRPPEKNHPEKNHGIRGFFGIDCYKMKMGAFPGYVGARPPT